MMIVTNADLLLRAKKGGYAVPAFNVDNLESVLGVLNAIEKTSKSAIIQTIPRTLKYGGTATYSALVRALYKGGADISIHLDHGGDIKTCEDCIKAGYTSVMIDGSMLDFDKNVELTKQVVELAHSNGVSVEAELGTIGGKEETEGEIKYTEVDEAVEFVKKTGVDSLAIGVGTAHGVYKGEPHIAIDRIKEIASVVDIPLVLHGASGLSDEVIRACIDAGISKINFATHLRQAFSEGLKKGLASDGATYDPKTYLPYAIKAVEDVATKIIKLCQPE
ncbi:MAG: class II fructose-bisphosphate aldolase family protein [Clostridia bacterium]|nr:class II fructose-bisphosphate aldolase family protein [Clostridia bacterium]